MKKHSSSKYIEENKEPDSSRNGKLPVEVKVEQENKKRSKAVKLMSLEMDLLAAEKTVSITQSFKRSLFYDVIKVKMCTIKKERKKERSFSHQMEKRELGC